MDWDEDEELNQDFTFPAEKQKVNKVLMASPLWILFSV